MSKHGLGEHYHSWRAEGSCSNLLGSKRREERVRDARRVILFEKTPELFLTILAEAWVVLILNILYICVGG
jgi:hypothetical protein